MTGPMVCMSCGGPSYWSAGSGIVHRVGRKYIRSCPGPKMRRCPRCTEYVPLDDFYPMRPNRPPGTRQAWCKACFRDYQARV